MTVGKGPTFTGKGKPTAKHLFHHVFSVGEIRRDPVKSSEPRSVLKVIGSCGDTPCMGSWIRDLGGKIRTFPSVGPKVVGPSNSLKIHPIAVFLLLTVIALLHT